MEIKKSTTYQEFINIMNKTRNVEQMRITPSVSVVCIDSDYYEMDVHNQTFGKLHLVSALSYKRGSAVAEEQLKSLKKIKHDVEVSSVEDERCKLCYFRRVNMYY